MTFNFFVVRDYDDTTEDVMFPRAEAASQSVLLTPEDGGDVRRVVATSVELAHLGKSKRHRQFRLDSIKAEVIVTDSRLAIAVAKYDKGGGWVGGASALALNAVSMARAAVRSRGTCLVGHLRYPWISIVGHGAGYSLMGNRKNDQLRLIFSIPSSKQGRVITVLIETDLAPDVSGHRLAETVVQRAAQYRLANNPRLSDEDRAGLESYRRNGISDDVTRDRWTQVKLHGLLPAMPETAHYGNGSQDAAEGAGDTAAGEQ